jgi:predicted glycosyltransferase
MSGSDAGTMRGRGTRLLIYSQNGLGLGHLRRTSAIAGALSAAVPGTAVLLVVDSPAAGFFGAVRDLDYLKLPSILKVGPGDWRPVSLPVGFGEVQLLRRELLRTAVLGFRPDLLLVDHMPHGAMGELVPALEALRATGRRTKVVLGLRDILDEPQVVRRQWLAEGAMDALQRHYDRVLVYGRRDVFDVAEHYGFPPGVTARLHYTGYLCAASRTALPTRGRKDGRAQIVAMVGGGADGYELLRTVLEALPVVGAVRPCMATLLTGPFMPRASRLDLERLARNLPARIRESVRDLPRLVAAADAAVAMAGYNSSVEVLMAGTPAVLVPRPGPSAEQRIRARLFAQRGWVHTIDPEVLDGTTLAATVLDCFTAGPATTTAGRPDLGGLPVVVEHLRSLLEAPAKIPAAVRRP